MAALFGKTIILCKEWIFQIQFINNNNNNNNITIMTAFDVKITYGN